MHPKGTFCPAWSVLGSISAGPEDAAGRVRQSASRCQSRTGLKVESKSKRSQSRRGIPCRKVEWFCAKKSPAKSNWVCIMHFCFMIQVYTPYFCLFRMEICFKRWFWRWDNYSFLVFLMMTANRSRYSLIYFPLFLGLIFPLFGLSPLFLGLLTAIVGHFPSAFRFYCGIKARV